MGNLKVMPCRTDLIIMHGGTSLQVEYWVMDICILKFCEGGRIAKNKSEKRWTRRCVLMHTIYISCLDVKNKERTLL